MPPSEDDALDTTWVASWTAAAEAAQQPLRDALAAEIESHEAYASVVMPTVASRMHAEFAARLRQILEDT